MFENKTEEQAKKEILDMVAEYCDTFHNKKKEFEPGDRITYASRVYDHEEMCNLVDSTLELWLTSGRYTDEFEKAFAKYLGVKYCSLVNSGSSANLNAFMALTSPLLGERQVKPGDEMITVASGFPTTVTQEHHSYLQSTINYVYHKTLSQPLNQMDSPMYVLPLQLLSCQTKPPLTVSHPYYTVEL